MSFRLALLLSLAFWTSSSDLAAFAAPQGLNINGRREPLGIAASRVSFSWHYSGSASPAQCEIQIRDESNPSAVWTSPPLEGRRHIGVEFDLSQFLRSGHTYTWKVRSYDAPDSPGAWSESARFHIGLQHPDDWSGAKWISAPTDPEKVDSTTRLPVFRRRLMLKGEIAEAWLYATAHGLYSMHLNGSKIGDSFLAPGWTDYRKRLHTQAYDVTSLIKVGENTLGVAVGDGWFKGKVGLGWSKVYGENLSFISKLLIRYRDGRTQEIVTDSTWEFTGGPFTQADLQDGEHYDFSRSIPALYDSTHPQEWKAVQATAPDRFVFSPQPDEPVRATQILPATSLNKVSEGVYRIDFGQNLVGVVRIRLRGNAGDTVTLRHAEEVYRTGDKAGQLYVENLRGARATDSVQLAGSEEVLYEPTFTQHGFRYVEVSGLRGALHLSDVEAVVLGSDLPTIGHLETSSPLINQLISNVRWGQRGNFLSIPTDTPARDERLGWTGDIAVFAPTASRLSDARAFLSKWLDDAQDAQKPDGNLPAVVPQPRNEFDETGVGWNDAAIQVPHAVWKATGDHAFLKGHWALATDMYRFIRDSALSDGDFLEQGRMSWFSGDWLSLEKVDRRVEHPLIATAYLAHVSRLMAEMAAELGDSATQSLAEETNTQARNAFVKSYVRANGQIPPDTQTIYALTLGMDLVSDPVLRQAIGAQFVEKLANDGFHLRTGFLGTPWLLPALSRIGRDDLALRILLNEDYPSWGYEIRQGATTVWERWNSIQPNGEFGPVDMNSFNHYAYGAVLDWVFSRIGGVEILEPGYRRVRIDPLVSHPGLTNSTCRLQTSLGLLEISWKRTYETLEYTITVPTGCRAEINLAGQPVGLNVEGEAARELSPPNTKETEYQELGAGKHHFVRRVAPDAK